MAPEQIIAALGAAVGVLWALHLAGDARERARTDKLEALLTSSQATNATLIDLMEHDLGIKVPPAP